MRQTLLGLAVWAAAGRSAAAGEANCHFEAGVITLPAVVAGIAGDYILDTGAPRTTLDETQAQAAGFEGAALRGDVRLAGVLLPGQVLRVAPLDLRTWNLPTPISGVIGVDLLKTMVVDVSYAPCRVRLSAARAAPPMRGTTLPLGWDAGRPTVEATASDDVHEVRGRFVIATGLNAPLRLADDLAESPGAAKPAELNAEGVWLARLARVTFAGSEGHDVAAGLMKAEGEVVGALGGLVLANFHLRFDFPNGQLVVVPHR